MKITLLYLTVTKIFKIKFIEAFKDVNVNANYSIWHLFSIYDSTENLVFFLIHCIILFLQLYKFCSNSGETEDKENIQLVQEYNTSKLQLQFES